VARLEAAPTDGFAFEGVAAFPRRAVTLVAVRFFLACGRVRFAIEISYAGDTEGRG
jgi:hypothetical protein